MKYITTIVGREFEVEIVDDDHVVVDGVTYTVDFNSIGDQPVYSMIVDGNSYEAYVYPDEEGWQVLLHGRLFPTTVEDEREKRLRAASGGAIAQRGEFHLKAPMPGLVVAVSVVEGQQVEKGDVLVVLESMKMQNELKASREGVITRVRVQEGDSVDQRQTLLSVE